ncbi:tetratricopeptide repeat protein [Methylomonas rosea]|uniref:Tetratricopeptide repeat protein n=1 Tax=Methylomonas rosea TaxID=2952227 RepID=A0ABT1TTT9_9GAMM|nr:tetratricopeptide repeat protein [Methylomonas sp. WSC-7]MCQ8117766.1 tetratricopeptide repeat protein [Methylomonas sp. WSC-7]
MSLINQMLRDLEQRNTPNKTPAPKLELRPAPHTQHQRRWYWLIAFALTLPLHYVWRQTHSTQTEQPAVAAPAMALPAAPVQISAPTPTEPPKVAQPETPSANARGAQPAAIKTEQIIQPSKAVEPEVPPSPANAAPLPPTISPAVKPVKTQTPAEQADALYRRAKASRSPSAIQADLLNALQLNPSHLGARTLFLQILLKVPANPEEIADFVQESLQLFPDNLLFVKTQAHLYVQQKNFVAAINTLEQINPDSVDDTNYLSLLAASYQQQQRFLPAEHIYQRLTQQQPEKAEHWLGLAICQDKLNQTQEAAQAYQQALDKNTLNADVVNYIKQRLSALN